MLFTVGSTLACRWQRDSCSRLLALEASHEDFFPSHPNCSLLQTPVRAAIEAGEQAQGWHVGTTPRAIWQRRHSCQASTELHHTATASHLDPGTEKNGLLRIFLFSRWEKPHPFELVSILS
jgi:hypothetical protein